MKRLVLLAALLLFMGCAEESKEIPHVTDQERIKAEREKLSGMQSVGKPDKK